VTGSTPCTAERAHKLWDAMPRRRRARSRGAAAAAARAGGGRRRRRRRRGPPRPAQPHATTEDPSNRWRGRNRRRFSLARSGRVVGSSFGATAKTPVRSRSWASCLPRRLDLWTC
jgi:hypothetical protein